MPQLIRRHRQSQTVISYSPTLAVTESTASNNPDHPASPKVFNVLLGSDVYGNGFVVRFTQLEALQLIGILTSTEQPAPDNLFRQASRRKR